MFRDSFKVGPSNLFGIDIGLSGVKVAEITKKGLDGHKLVRFASIPLPEGSLIEDEIQKPEEIKQAILDAISEAGISTPNACLGLFGPNTISRKLQLAGGNYDEIADQVNWEAEQYIPFPIEESKLSFHILGENEGGGVEVIVAAARADVVENFKQLVETANVRVRIVDLSILALTNLFEVIKAELITDAMSSWIIIDFGAQKTNFLIYKNNMVIFSKEILLGGVSITEEIQRQMGVNYSEAEDLKIQGDENGNLPEEILEIIDDVLESFYLEIKKTLDFYVSSTSDESIRSCFLTGGSSRIPGLIDGIEALFSVEVEILNPFDHITYSDSDFDEDDINSIVYTGAVALGLALREIK